MSIVKKKTIGRKITSALITMGVLTVFGVGIFVPLIVATQLQQDNMDLDLAVLEEEVRAYTVQYKSLNPVDGEETFQDFYFRRQQSSSGNQYSIDLQEKDGVSAPPVSELHFFFIVKDLDGNVLLTPFPDGRLPARSRVMRMHPISQNGETIAWAFPVEPPELSESDRSYIQRTITAFLISLAIVIFFSVVWGVKLGRRIAGDLVHLTEEVRTAYPGGEDITTRDTAGAEVQSLAATFNNLLGEINQAHRKLVELSTVDELTGLYNRRFFRDESERILDLARRYDHPISLMICDLDHFKQVNDRFGHSIGDEVLRTISTILSEGIRSVDIAARWGGEEFVVLFPETGLDNAVSLCEKLRRQVEGFRWSEIADELSVTMSIGATDFHEHDQLDTMVDRADSNLYSAKDSGRNRVVAE